MLLSILFGSYHVHHIIFVKFCKSFLIVFHNKIHQFDTHFPWSYPQNPFIHFSREGCRVKIGKSLLSGALMLTAVNLLLRFAGTGFQVWLSGRIGASGVGLLQLILSINMLALTLGAAGGRTTAMYLTAETLGENDRLTRTDSCLVASSTASSVPGLSARHCSSSPLPWRKAGSEPPMHCLPCGPGQYSCR